MDTLAADVNRTGIHSLAVPDSFETDGSFTVELRNHGEATHVHLHIDDSLSSVARLEAGNHYVEAENTRPVRIHVDNDGLTEPVRGKLKVVTAYGAETHFVDVTITPTKKEPVDVDPDLSKPGAGGGAKRGRQRGSGDGLALDRSGLLSALPAVVLGVVAIVFAVGAVVRSGGTDPILAVLAIVAGVLAAGYLYLQ